MKSLQEREWFFSQDREEFSCTNPNPVYNVYRLKTTRQLICDVEIDAGLGIDEPIIIGAVADPHFNFCNMEDRQDEELAYTEQCRQWLKEQKSLVAAVKALEACDFCDAGVVLGDILDYLSRGAAHLTKTHIIKKYPEIMMAVGGHDITKQMQTKIPDKLPLEEREGMIKEFWPHDIYYYSRVIKDKVKVIVLNNSCSHYLDCQVDKLKDDIDEARANGRIVLICQHEPIVTKDRTEKISKAVIANGGAMAEVDFNDINIVGGENNCSETTKQVYDLITKNADVVKAVIAGHWHSQFYGEILASYEWDGAVIDTKIPQYVISGNPYHEAGFLARFIIK